MNKIDTSKWSVFSVEYLFRALKCTKKVGQKETHGKGEVPVYSSESLNNGIVGYCNLEPTWIVDHENPLYLIFGDHTRAFHIADSSFCVADNVKVLLPLHAEMSVKVLQYISSVWQREIPDLGYSRHWSVAKKVRILLPSKDGEPDWNYMENYMHHIEQKVESSLRALINTEKKNREVNMSFWREFELGTLFNAERGKVKKLQAINAGNTPVIAAARSKQGVAGFYDVDAIYRDKITISCNGVGCGSTFYHDYPFNINGDALVLIEKQKMSKAALQFITCILDGHLTRKYSYEEKCSPEKALREKILLPAKGDQPDWHYMEMYMRGVEAIVKNKLSLLIPHKSEVAIKEATTVNIATYNDYSKTINVEK